MIGLKRKMEMPRSSNISMAKCAILEAGSAPIDIHA